MFSLYMESGRDEGEEDRCLVSIWNQVGIKGRKTTFCFFMKSGRDEGEEDSFLSLLKQVGMKGRKTAFASVWKQEG